MSGRVPQRRGRDTDFSVPPECGEMIRRGALVALNVSGGKDGIVKLIECRLFLAFLHEAKLLNLRGGAIDNVPRFRSESG